MEDRLSRYAEVVVELRPMGGSGMYDASAPESQALSTSTASERVQSYQALIYADPTEFSHLAGPLKGYPCNQRGDLPLIAVEEISVRWSAYENYLAAFAASESTASAVLMKEALFENVSKGLCTLLGGEGAGGEPVRVWWSSTIPSLVELPWELLARTGEGSFNQHLSFVRGLPPDSPVPKIPVGEKLRLAFIHQPTDTPDGLGEALRALDGVEVSDITEPPLQALQKAVREEFQLVHMVADGSISLANEGFLYLRKPQTLDISSKVHDGVLRDGLRWLLKGYEKVAPKLPQGLSSTLSDLFYQQLNIETLSPAELSSLQWGSPLSILSLSAPKSAGNSQLNSLFSPSIHRAFANFGNSALPMPNIVAQIGAVDPQRLNQFWQRFYQSLATTNDVEQAMIEGRAGEDGAVFPLALFLRQRQRGTFTKEDGERKSNPALINAELHRSRETLARLRDMKLQFPNLADFAATFEKEELARQQLLEELLKPWV
jgi:hypothetical protein